MQTPAAQPYKVFYRQNEMLDDVADLHACLFALDKADSEDFLTSKQSKSEFLRHLFGNTHSQFNHSPLAELERYSSSFDNLSSN